jgi:hypothetical protein
MTEDITFCYNSRCKNKKCERHISHIKKHYIPHSFAFFKDCKYWDAKEIEHYTVSQQGGVNDG